MDEKTKDGGVLSTKVSQVASDDAEGCEALSKACNTMVEDFGINIEVWSKLRDKANSLIRSW